LGELVKKGAIGRLEVVNVAVLPEIAAAMGVRSVPWLRLGEFELEGAMREAELQQWIRESQSEQGMANYFDYMLSAGRLAAVERDVRAHPPRMHELLSIAADPNRNMNARIGVSAVCESIQGSDLLAGSMEQLGDMSRVDHAAVRADAAYLLGLTGDSKAVTYLQELQHDENPDVREIAMQALQVLGG